ncbi:DNA-3-methyladenine glycosylase I [Ranunculus cassubicifolius]
MAKPNATTEELSKFLNSGIYRFKSESNITFIDPIRILNRNYTQFRVSPSSYHSRFLKSNSNNETRVSTDPHKRKRKKRKLHNLNEREQCADQRHKEARPLLLKAHEALLKDSDILSVLSDLRRNGGCSEVGSSKESVLSFIELGSVWQAPMYEISLCFGTKENQVDSKG